MSEEFRKAIEAFDMLPPVYIPAGRWIRFAGAGKKSSNKSAWAYLFPDEKGGVFGDWSAEVSTQVWQAECVSTYSKAELAAHHAAVALARADAERRRDEEYAEAAIKATADFEASDAASDSHPYLVKKGIKAYGIRQRGNDLIVPLYAPSIGITTYQTITPDGEKKLMFGGRKKGSAFPIKNKDDKNEYRYSQKVTTVSPVYVVEGYATGVTVFEATGCRTLVAIDAHNIAPVVENAIAAGYGRIVIAADNDHHLPENVGGNAAKKVCKLHPDRVEVFAPPAIPNAPKGTDWNDYAQKYGLAAVVALFADSDDTYRVCTAEELMEENKSTPIPADLYEGIGLLGEGMDVVKELGCVDIPQYNFASVLILLSTILAGKICFRGVHPSCFFVKIGKTGSGKTNADKFLKQLIAPHFTRMIGDDDSKREVSNSIYSVTDFSSGAGLYKVVQGHLRSLIVLDEITPIFMGGANGRIDPIAQSKCTAILELSTSAGTPLEKGYADGAKKIFINHHVVNLIGNATPLIFKIFSLNDLQSGLLQRFDFFSYDGLAPYNDSMYDVTAPQYNDKLVKGWVGKLVALHAIEKPKGKYDILADSAIDIGIDDHAKMFMKKLSRTITDAIRAEPDDGLAGIIGRAHDTAIKFALIHAGVTRAPKDIFNPLTLEDVQWGAQNANIQMAWKLNILKKNIVSGVFHELCNTFIEGAKAAVKAHQLPTLKSIQGRKIRLKNVSPREMDEVIKKCISLGAVRATEGSRGAIAYEPITEKDKVIK